MNEKDFFAEIEHIEVPWGSRTIMCPVFFYDVMSFGIYMLASIEKVKAILPSKRMQPYRVMPQRCLVSVLVLKYRQSDIGPYNEVSISIPFTLDQVSPLFTGLLRKIPEVPMVYIHQMPVTTQIALDAGVEFSGFPKFMAEINITEKDDRVSCHLGAGDKQILTLSGRKLPLAPGERTNMHIITYRNGYLLRTGFVISEREMGISKNTDDVRLDFGDHQIAYDLRELDLGKIVSYQYTPNFQAIQTPAYESYAV